MRHVSAAAIVPLARRLYQGCRHAHAYWNSLPPERQEYIFRVVEGRLARGRTLAERRLGPKATERGAVSGR